MAIQFSSFKKNLTIDGELVGNHFRDNELFFRKVG